MITLHGIPNCDTCRKASKWFATQGIDYQFFDLRRDGLDVATVEAWLREIGSDKLINRRGTTWRGLTDDEKARAESNDAAVFLVANPTLLKRPIIDIGKCRLVGFDAHVTSVLERSS